MKINSFKVYDKSCSVFLLSLNPFLLGTAFSQNHCQYIMGPLSIDHRSPSYALLIPCLHVMQTSVSRT